MKYCLIENLNNDYSLPKNYTYVALTQEAIYYLDKRNVKYITMEDFYSSGEIRGNTEKFLVDQLEWIAFFDKKIKEIYPDAKKLNMKLATIYFHWIKYMVDNIILTCKVIQKFIDSTNPQKILFINNNHGTDDLGHWEHILHFQGVESTYSRITPLFCSKNNIEFDRIIIKIKKEKQNNFDLKLKLKSIFPLAITKYHNIIKYGKILKFLLTQNGLNSKKTYNALFFSTQNFVKEFSKDLGHNSVKNYVFDNGNVYGYELPFIKKKSVKIDSSYQLKKINEENIFIDFNEIYRWINLKCNIDVSDVIKTRLDTFVYSICPNIIYLTKIFLDYYNKEKIDFIVTSHIFTLEEHAAIAAANLSKTTKSIYFHHGADAYEFNCRYFLLVKNFDYYFTTTFNEAKHEELIRNKYGFKLPIISSSNYFSNQYST